MASMRAPATPSRENSRTAACRMAARLSSGRPREPRRGLERVAFIDFILINQLVRLYTGGERRAIHFFARNIYNPRELGWSGRIMKYRKLGRTGFEVSE